MQLSRLGAIIAAAIPTVVTLFSGARNSGRHLLLMTDQLDATSINTYLTWQSVVGLGVPILLAAAPSLWPRRAITVAAPILLAVCTLAAAAMALIRGSLPAELPFLAAVAAWLFVPCFAVSAGCLWWHHRHTASAKPAIDSDSAGSSAERQ